MTYTLTQMHEKGNQIEPYRYYVYVWRLCVCSHANRYVALQWPRLRQKPCPFADDFYPSRAHDVMAYAPAKRVRAKKIYIARVDDGCTMNTNNKKKFKTRANGVRFAQGLWCISQWCGWPAPAVVLMCVRIAYNGARVLVPLCVWGWMLRTGWTGGGGRTIACPRPPPTATSP